MNQVIIDAIRNGLMWIGLGALLLIAAVCMSVGLRRVSKALYVRLSPVTVGVFAVVAIFATCEAQKRLLRDGGGGRGATALPSVTAEEIAQGWRLESVTTNDAVSYVMPEGVSPPFNWHKRGTFGEWARLELGGFAFPLGTNSGAVTSFERVVKLPSLRNSICALYCPVRSRPAYTFSHVRTFPR